MYRIRSIINYLNFFSGTFAYQFWILKYVLCFKCKDMHLFTFITSRTMRKISTLLHLVSYHAKGSSYYLVRDSTYVYNIVKRRVLSRMGRVSQSHKGVQTLTPQCKSNFCERRSVSLHYMNGI